MPRARITELRRDAATAPVTADVADLDAALGVYTLFFDIPRFEVVYFRLVLESWEDGAVARTMTRFQLGDPQRSLVVAIVVPDFVESCVRRLERLCQEIDGFQVRTTRALRDRLRTDLSDEEFSEDDA